MNVYRGRFRSSQGRSCLLQLQGSSKCALITGCKHAQFGYKLIACASDLRTGVSTAAAFYLILFNTSAGVSFWGLSIACRSDNTNVITYITVIARYHRFHTSSLRCQSVSFLPLRVSSYSSPLCIWQRVTPTRLCVVVFDAMLHDVWSL